MKGQISITRRLVISVLLVEIVAALTLLISIAVHEYHLQLSAFDAQLRGGAESLLGSVQDAEDAADNVVLEMSDVHLGKKAAYLVQERNGKVLGRFGSVEGSEFAGKENFIFEKKMAKETYRWIVLPGTKIIDPGRPDGGVVHRVVVIYGLPLGHVWHEVFEAIRFFALATLIVLLITTLLILVMMRKVLQPLRDLAVEAGKISPFNWSFTTPENASKTKELEPLAGALRAALERLQLSFSQQKRFTSNAAHELKTDVAIVKSSVQLLSMKDRSLEEYRVGLAKILADMERLQNTVQAMLTLARLEYAVATPQSTCYFGQAIEESLSLCTPYAAMRSVSFVSKISFDPSVPIDSRDAVLLCSNLLMNAIQHSAAGQEIEINLTRENSLAKLEVVDFGEGIQEEDLPFLFEAFYRGDPSRSRKSGGTGLGLAICKAICDRASGSIGLKRGSAKGTNATVMVPFLAIREVEN